MRAYVLVVDVGNTATSIGVFDAVSSKKNPIPVHVWTMSTHDIPRSKSFARFVSKNIKAARIPVSSVLSGIISSVVPPIDGPLRSQIRSMFKKDFSFVSSTTRSRVRVLYRKPSEVGADRIVNARAAIALWKGPSIVIDFGTATTFDCVTASGGYLGGVIAPGPVISAEALYDRTAKLPMVLLSKPVNILGRNTLESIQAGLYHGYRGLVKEIVFQLRKKMGPRTRVMATGGQAHWILKGVNGVDAHVPHLTLLGLFHMWRDEDLK